MEQSFQTSFIPKRPITEEKVPVSNPFGFLTVVSIFIFLTMLVASGGLYFYKGMMDKNILAMENELNLIKNRFEPAKIAQLQVLDKRLKASAQVLDNHVAITPIFEALQKVTMKSVRFTKFSYELVTQPSPKIEVKMSGIAVSYRTVALQADLFSKEKYFIDPIFSNLTLDDKGNVVFDLDFAVEPDFVDYGEMVEITSGANDAILPQNETSPSIEEDLETFLDSSIEESISNQP